MMTITPEFSAHFLEVYIKKTEEAKAGSGLRIRLCRRIWPGIAQRQPCILVTETETLGYETLAGPSLTLPVSLLLKRRQSARGRCKERLGDPAGTQACSPLAG